MDFDRDRGQEILKKYFCDTELEPRDFVHFEIAKDHLTLNSVTLKRKNKKFAMKDYKLHRIQFDALESLMFCIEHNWLAILVGQEGSGKTRYMSKSITEKFFSLNYIQFVCSLINILSELLGNPVKTITLTSASDTSELLGGFEQVNI